jgi:hypothetical protein
MSSLQGVPQAMRDVSRSNGLPSYVFYRILF